MHFWLLLSCVAALMPVSDFRVDNMPLPLARQPKNPPRVQYGFLLRALAPEAIVRSDPLVVELTTDVHRSLFWVNLLTTQTSRFASSSASPSPIHEQEFPMVLETGTPLAFIANSSCDTDICNRVPRFAAHTVTPIEFSLEYFTGNITGFLVDGPKSNIFYTLADQVRATNFTCGYTSSGPAFFADYNVSGILGLSYNASIANGTNFVQQLATEKTIASLKFGLVLDAPVGAKESFGGLLLLGQMADTYTTTLAQSAVVSRPVLANEHGYWMLWVPQVSVVSMTGANSAFAEAVRIVLDTGTSGLALPLAAADSMHQLLFGSQYVADGRGNYAFPCNATGSVTFNVDGLVLNMPVALIVADRYTTAALEGMCASRMQGVARSTDWILGSSFLANFYTIFDVDNQAMGFAPRVLLYQYLSTSVSTSSAAASTLALAQSSEAASTLALAQSSESTTRSAGGVVHTTPRFVFGLACILGILM